MYVRGPVRTLVGELKAEFGQATVFRPYRDIRLSADRSPYKTFQGAFAERLAGSGSTCGQLSGSGPGSPPRARRPSRSR